VFLLQVKEDQVQIGIGRFLPIHEDALLCQVINQTCVVKVQAGADTAAFRFLEHLPEKLVKGALGVA
jgi:hypothetical protein